MTDHAELSARIVEGVLRPEQVDWIRNHHERPDGDGYPDGLSARRALRGSGAARDGRRLGRDDDQPSLQLAQERREALNECIADRPPVHPPTGR